MNWSKLLVKILVVAFVGSSGMGQVYAQSGEIRTVDIDAPVSADAEEIIEQYSEFDNHIGRYVKSPSEADADYEDTEFGEILYNEASLPTRLEILRLLSKETPSTAVFLQGMAMGLGVEDVLTAAVRFDSKRGSDYVSSAISILPLLSDVREYNYISYDLDDVDEEDNREDAKPADDLGVYSVAEIADRFFADREVLVPHPDWIEGQYHFQASATELKELKLKNEDNGTDLKWYRNRSTVATTDRPVFVSLYEAEGSIFIDGQSRIDDALEQYGEDALVPVVFIYNKLNERAIDQLGYPKTIKGVRGAYRELNLMATPTPEWQTGEFHVLAEMEEVYELFAVPEEEDFEPEHWQRLLEEAENYKVSNTAFVCVVLSVGGVDELSRTSIGADYQVAISDVSGGTTYDDPRTEADFPYIARGNVKSDLKDILRSGLIMNRLDLIAALNALGVTWVPTAFYYLDNSRMNPQRPTIPMLKAIAQGAGTPAGSFGGSGGFGPPPEEPTDCASPPCNN